MRHWATFIGMNRPPPPLTLYPVLFILPWPPHLKNKTFTKLSWCQQVVLELCRNDDFASPQGIQPHLSRINTYITNQEKEVGALVKSPSFCLSFAFTYVLFYFLRKTSSSEVKASVTSFFKLVHTLVEDQCQREIFYQVSWLLWYLLRICPMGKKCSKFLSL